MPQDTSLGQGQGSDAPRIGVFICHCGVNIGGFLDVPAVTEHAATLDGVAHSEHNLYTCAEDGLQAIKNAIKGKGLNRVIVASCTPRTHEPLFRAACVDAGLNKYLFEMVNIREQCSWVHMEQRGDATEKAKELIRMAVARSRLLEPLEEGTVEVTPTVLVIGGGVSGMSAATSVAHQGFRVFLVERKDDLGGMVRDWRTIGPGDRSPEEIIGHFKVFLDISDRAEVLTGSEVVEVSGYVGNFDVKVRTPSGERLLKIGTIIVAAGSLPLVPEGLYGFGELDGVITMADLELDWPGKVDDVVMIQCTGARGERVSYCSRICCTVALNNAVGLKRQLPDANVTILHRDMMAYGDENEELYVKARDLGARFVRYDPDRRPTVSRADGGLMVKVHNEPYGREEEIRADMVVLSTPLVPRDGFKDISKMLKVPLGQDGFFFEAHVKLRPVDFATDGIFLAGSCRAPCNVPEAVAQGRAAASRATIPLAKGKVLADGAIAQVDPDMCWGCGKCVEVCPYGAPALIQEGGRRISSINKVLCKGCGVCVVNCPVTAITARHFTHDQVLGMIASLAMGSTKQACDRHGGGADG